MMVSVGSTLSRFTLNWFNAFKVHSTLVQSAECWLKSFNAGTLELIKFDATSVQRWGYYHHIHSKSILQISKCWFIIDYSKSVLQISKCSS